LARLILSVHDECVEACSALATEVKHVRLTVGAVCGAGHAVICAQIVVSRAAGCYIMALVICNGPVGIRVGTVTGVINRVVLVSIRALRANSRFENTLLTICVVALSAVVHAITGVIDTAVDQVNAIVVISLKLVGKAVALVGSVVQSVSRIALAAVSCDIPTSRAVRVTIEELVGAVVVLAWVSDKHHGAGTRAVNYFAIGANTLTISFEVCGVKSVIRAGHAPTGKISASAAVSGTLQTVVVAVVVLAIVASHEQWDTGSTRIAVVRGTAALPKLCVSKHGIYVP